MGFRQDPVRPEAQDGDEDQPEDDVPRHVGGGRRQIDELEKLGQGDQNQGSEGGADQVAGASRMTMARM